MKHKYMVLGGLLLLATHTLLAITVHGGTLRGLVTEKNTREELAGASVQLLEPRLHTITNELGLFAFADLPSGRYTLVVSLIGMQQDTTVVQVIDHETVSVKIALREAELRLADVAVQTVRAKPLQTLSRLDLATRPIQSAQDVLRAVPGLVIAQHAGGGKAEQIFLRGFDVDHGTDVALFADGIPVNMVSHAHGQGYADLHFIIPELVQNVDFQKGTYDESVGDFATAGYVRFRTSDVLSANFVKVEGGQFSTFRQVAALNVLGPAQAARGTSAYIAAENMFSNGYFDAPQNFKRNNLFGKFRQVVDERQTLTISAGRFQSSWLASGQIPARAVRSGLIGRFGAIDPTEGGATGRQNLNVEHAIAVTDATLFKNQFYLSKYDFELYSNFTFFLHDSINGDQIRQRENRLLSGYNGSFSTVTHFWGKPFQMEGGLQLRYDQVRGNELSRTRNRRETLRQLALGDVQQINTAPWVKASLSLSPRLTAAVGARLDAFHFSYQNALDSTFTDKTAVKMRFSPKVNIAWQALRTVQIFGQMGYGFHSNDTRVATANTTANTVPRALGTEIGMLAKPFPNLLLSAALWRLDLEQEFIYVGDEAVVEAGGRTLRHGLDLSARWQVGRHLFVDADYNYTLPRTLGVPEGEYYIPLAPTRTAIGGLTYQSPTFTGSLRMRHVGNRAANETYSLVAEGFLLADAQLTFAPAIRNQSRPLELTLSIQNLTNAAWKEAQFETETRLRGEAEPVTEIHYTPGTPFFGKVAVLYRF